jgi:hypothetical protein
MDLATPRAEQLVTAGLAFSAFNGFSRQLRLPYWHEAGVLVEALHRLDKHRGVG